MLPASSWVPQAILGSLGHEGQRSFGNREKSQWPYAWLSGDLVGVGGETSWAGDSQPWRVSGKWSVHVPGAVGGSRGAPGGRRAEPWIQALKVYQEQRARQASGWKGAGGKGKQRWVPKLEEPRGPPWPSLRSCSTGSKHLPSLAPPAAVTGDPQPLPTPLTGTGATHVPPSHQLATLTLPSLGIGPVDPGGEGAGFPPQTLELCPPCREPWHQQQQVAPEPP